MDISAIVSQVVEGLTSGIVAYGQAIGEGISKIVSSMMFTTTGEGASATTSLSPYFIMVLVFASIAIVTGLTTLIFTWLGNLGGGR